MVTREIKISVVIKGVEFAVGQLYSEVKDKFKQIFGENITEYNEVDTLLCSNKTEIQFSRDKHSTCIVVPEEQLSCVKIMLGDLSITGNLDDILYATSLVTGLEIAKEQTDYKIDKIKDLNGYSISIYTINGARKLEIKVNKEA